MTDGESFPALKRLFVRVHPRVFPKFEPALIACKDAASVVVFDVILQVDGEGKSQRTMIAARLLIRLRKTTQLSF